MLLTNQTILKVPAHKILGASTLVQDKHGIKMATKGLSGKGFSVVLYPKQPVRKDTDTKRQGKLQDFRI